jgi:hypothetical protein
MPWWYALQLGSSWSGGGGTLLSLAHGLLWLSPAGCNKKALACLMLNKTFAMPV